MCVLHLWWYGTDFRSCQVSATKMCAANRRSHCADIKVGVLDTTARPRHIYSYSNTWPGPDGKVKEPLNRCPRCSRCRKTSVLPRKQIPSHRAVFSIIGTLPVPPRWLTTMVPPLLELNTVIVTLMCKWECVRRNWDWEGLESYILNMCRRSPNLSTSPYISLKCNGTVNHFISRDTEYIFVMFLGSWYVQALQAGMLFLGNNRSLPLFQVLTNLPSWFTVQEPETGTFYIFITLLWLMSAVASWH